ncbi:hypothetical protein SEA_KINGBOB_35 [Arthrobacter phage KingBob]|uniref:Uncharacterized protein n=1 Tax=Arthrobacter phage Sergei TaxID=2250416 RepID=A0A345KPX3_9CAUD|nr:hypothetical protein KDJ06_gp35 [Arthrobacter phage Sergei]ASZ74349.1 hypothetical protein TEMPER16_35 [Arthrobacter phage Temper16]AXH43962.1 hypothetical protein SEA_DAIBOJU_35 [Arthrobacter phage Daiboju]AXH44024.1 hypothetical protein SEA_HERB_35 [Arthrobacter phage Herb]AXH44268.1 hypothetical protein SEA_KINGBOB_35 [Arthrobacter phage KingBob]QGJ97175.1 hypothetical protein SEA_MARIA1952_34 [Arthrobacter phage Maria1952]
MSNTTEHYTATVEIVRVSRTPGSTSYNTTAARNEPKPGERVKEEVMKVTVRDESLRGLVNKVTAILEVNVPTPAMVAEREGE